VSSAFAAGFGGQVCGPGDWIGVIGSSSSVF
jgi:hypothetical protein